MEQLEYLVKRIDQFENKLDKIDEKYDTKLDKILEQTTKTNGQVTVLKSEMIDVQQKVSKVEEVTNVNKGRDTTLWVLGCAVGAIITLIIGHFISKL